MGYMRKLLSFLFILMLGVFTSACVNTFAVHELNQIAAEYLEEGQIDAVISRLESSVDLDENVYESRYNLAVAYMRKNMCKEALEHIAVADKLTKNEPAVHYTYGVASHCVAEKILNPKDANGNEINTDNYTPIDKYKIQQNYIAHLEVAIKHLDIYSKLAPNADDTKDVISLVNKWQIELNEAKIKYPKLSSD